MLGPLLDFRLGVWGAGGGVREPVWPIRVRNRSRFGLGATGLGAGLNLQLWRSRGWKPGADH